MSSRDECVCLHIFSGLHIGAELVLAEGQYIFGTEDSCDFIFADASLAGRHAALTIERTEAGEIQCIVQPLDGLLLLDGQEQQERAVLPQAKLCFAGLVAWAWLPSAIASAERASTWEALNTTLHQTSPASDALDKAQPQQAEGQEEQADSPNTSPQAVAEQNIETTQLAMESPDANIIVKKQQSSRNWVLFFLALMLVAAFSFRYEYREQPEPLAVLKAALAEQNITGLSVQQNANKTIQISGTVPDDATRATLSRFVRSLPFPVLLDIVVANDSQEAILAAFTSRGFYPVLSVEPPKKLSAAEVQHMPVLGTNTPWAAKSLDAVEVLVPPATSPMPPAQTEQQNMGIQKKVPDEATQVAPPLTACYLSCYVKNPATEAWLFEQIQADISSIAKPSAQGRSPFIARILHQEDIQAVLEPALRAAQISTASINYLAGSLDIIGTFDSRQREIIGTVLAEVEKELALPLHTRHIGTAATAPNSVLLPTKGNAETGARTGNSALAEENNGTFRVTGVTMKPIPFIQLASGQRIFEGGSLPDGSVLEKISIDVLQLRRNGASSAYPLRGFHE